ncbi:MAG: rhodanese-like domain-containing protein [Flavobacteriaceae bacterium]
MSSARTLIILSLILATACREASIESALKRYNSGSVPYIKPSEINPEGQYFVMDAREKEEYKISHIPGAFWIGDSTFKIDSLKQSLPSDTNIMIYCSVGIRSEDVGEILLERGFTNVYNLYGGIFEWKNNGGVVVDSLGKKTENVHAYSKYWGHLLTEANKVY